MMHFITQYGPTVLILAALVAFFAFLIVGMIRDRKKGKSSCCGGCAGCANACYCHPAAKEAAPEGQRAQVNADSAEGGN